MDYKIEKRFYFKLFFKLSEIFNGYSTLENQQTLIVHGWEDLASQNGYPQDIINEKVIQNMDFVVAIFKHKLGTPTINQVTGLKRAESGTAEELLQALDTSKKNYPLGMAYFYSKAPVVSIDSSGFDNACIASHVCPAYTG